MDLKKYFAEKKEEVELAIKDLLADDQIPSDLKEAMKYSLKAGGKRFRPILVMAGAEAVGGRAGDVLNIACALEFIHTFSLIHDDLPSMDNDDLRRGKPTNHKVFGEAKAILSGDALMIEAFYVLSGKYKKCDPNVCLEIIQDIANAAGARGMTGGQVIDMVSEGKQITEKELNKLHNLKTGRLITVSVTSGAKCCNASNTQVDALKKYGDLLGLAFQIADDILDIEGDEKELGKDVGSDIENNKSTYPSIIGLENSKTKAEFLVKQAIDSLSMFDQKADPLREIAKYTIQRRN